MFNRSIRINYWAVIVTGLCSFILSLLWYSSVLFGPIWMRYRSSASSAPAWTMLLAPLRELIASYVLALLITRLQLVNWKDSLSLTVLLWIAFHAVGMAGAIIWDNMPWPLGMVHAGDWLMKMIFMAFVLSWWHRKYFLEAKS